jgi:hypothetical protein
MLIKPEDLEFHGDVFNKIHNTLVQIEGILASTLGITTH